jgi:hypothetical protein
LRTDRRLYLVSSQPGAPASAVRARRSHLRLVAVEPEPEAPLTALAPASTARPIEPSRPQVRPFGQRMMQVASDAAVFAVALLVGLRPNA